jgi:anthrone oxygenase-like protein
LLEALEFLAVISAALFAGAALYINVAEHPARMLLEPRNGVTQWAPSYKRATWMQAPLALTSFVAGLAVWLIGGGHGWLVAAVLIGAVVPFTFIIIMPTNRRLLATARELDPVELRALLQKWAMLHAGRTLLSICATGVYGWLVVAA